MAIFSRQEIQDGLRRLGELAQAQGLHVRLALVGGAAMVLGYEARQSTRDVDVVILSPAEARLVRNLVKRIATERDWPEDWLNDGAKGYLVGISKGPLFSVPGIEALSPSIEQLLAMKLCVWRDDLDISDARRLLQEILQSVSGKDEIWESLEPYLVPGDELTAQYAFLDLWETLYGTD